MLALPRLSWVATATIAVVAVSGCASLEDCKYETAQRIRTGQAWKEFNSCSDQCFTRDYASGWKAGFYDVATGGSGCPPLVAPKKYSKPPVFFERDESCRDAWYTGFQDGACCAKSQPDYHYLKLWAPGPPVCLCPVSFSPTHASVPPSEPLMPYSHEAHEASEPVVLPEHVPAVESGSSAGSSTDVAPEPKSPSAAPQSDAAPADVEPFKTQPVKTPPAAVQPRPYESRNTPVWDIEVIPIDKTATPATPVASRKVAQKASPPPPQSFTARLYSAMSPGQ